MQIYRALPDPPLAEPTALTIGNFDGVHLGHHTLIRAMMEAARQRDWRVGLVTFDPHPMAVLRPDAPLPYLTTVAERLDMLGKLGLDFTVVYPFTPETAQTPARAFVSRMRRSLAMASLWVGPDFALGRNREGDLDALRLMGTELGFEVRVIAPQLISGSEVRSGRIRDHLSEGAVSKAARMLGRWYEVPGVVVVGASRGRTIGFPTANLETSPGRLLPANGVYATWARLGGPPPAEVGWLGSVTNVGVRPSFDNGNRTVETHLLDFTGDLYGQPVVLEFVRRLRPERRFSDVEALRHQITLDVQAAREVLAEFPVEQRKLRSTE